MKGFKPINNNQGEGIIKIRIEEPSGALLENWTIMMSDLGKWTNLMRKKYKIIDKQESDRDLEWIR